MQAIATSKHPTLAVIEGACVGGGLEIASVCDMRICGTSSRFGVPVNKLGLTMSYGELGGLIDLLAPLGINERLVRTSVFRLAREGWLKAKPIGRESLYRLTRDGARRFRQAYRRIYSPPQSSICFRELSWESGRRCWMIRVTAFSMT